MFAQPLIGPFLGLLNSSTSLRCPHSQSSICLDSTPQTQGSTSPHPSQSDFLSDPRRADSGPTPHASSQPSTKAAPLKGLRKVLVTCPSCTHTQFLLPPLGCSSPIPSLSSFCFTGHPITFPSDSSPPFSQSLAPSPGPEFYLLFSEFHQYLTTFGLSGCFICVQKLIS